MGLTHATAHDPLGPRLEIALLGPPTVSWAGRPLQIPRRQVRALLYRLAAAPHPLPRDHLSFLLWPDSAQAVARRNLTVLVAQLRRALPQPDLLVAPADSVGLRAEAVAVDTAAFSALVPNALRGRELGAVAAATRLYRGAFLDGFALADATEFEIWIDQERHSWERRYLDALTALVAGYRAEGAYPEAIAAAQEALAADPLCEELHRGLMELYAAQGDRAAAMRQFERCVVVLERELDVGPLPPTRALYEAIRDGCYAAPALPSPGGSARAEGGPGSDGGATAAFAPSRPPVPLGELVGRTGEIAALCEQLAAPDVRLLTLTGPGGCGKTRLALELARHVEQHFPDGAVFVSLAPLRDPGLLLDAIAQACGVTGAGTPSLEVALRAALAGRRALLVLDNLEHLLAAAPALAGLLQALPQLRLLVTSRRVLNLSGEHVFPVPPLPLPDLALLPPADELAAQPAVALLVARTRALSPHFALTAENAVALAAICVRLDGLPLALELAAARLRLMSAESLLRRLDHRLTLLTHGPHDLPERQRALRAVIAWSDGLLDSPARALFAHTAIFAGSWSLDAAEELGGAAGHPSLRSPQGALDALAALIDASLVRQVVGRAGEPRMELLETIREYALERLGERGALAAAADAHMRIYAGYAAEAAAHLRTADAARWLDRIEDDEPNLLAALEHASATHDTVAALRLLEPLVRFWAVRGHLHEGRHWIERALRPLTLLAPQLGASGDPSEPDARPRLARVCLTTADIYFLQGEYTAAAPYLEASVELWRTLDQPGWLSMALITLAGAHALAGDTAAAAAPLAEGEALAESVGDGEARAWLALDYGRMARHRGQPRAAHRWLSEAARHYRARGDLWLLAGVLLDLAPVLLALGDEAAAESHTVEALALAEQLKSQTGIAIACNELGEIARYRGREREAEAHYAESMRLLRRMGNRSEEPRLQHNLAYIALHCGDVAAAAAGFAECLALFAERQVERGVMEGLIGLAAVATALGRPLEAARLWGAAAELGAAEHWDLWPPDQLAYARAVAQARAMSERSAFEAAWQEGRGMPIDAACALATDVWRRAAAGVGGGRNL